MYNYYKIYIIHFILYHNLNWNDQRKVNRYYTDDLLKFDVYTECKIKIICHNPMVPNYLISSSGQNICFKITVCRCGKQVYNTYRQKHDVTV